MVSQIRLVVNYCSLQIKHIAYAWPVARPIFNHFLYLFVRFFVYYVVDRLRSERCFSPPCHHILAEVPKEPTYPLTGELHCTHYAQTYCCHFRTRVTPVVLYSFSQRRKWSDLTFGQVVVYRISSILAVHEQAFLEVVEVVQSLGHVITSFRIRLW